MLVPQVRKSGMGRCASIDDAGVAVSSNVERPLYPAVRYHPGISLPVSHVSASGDVLIVMLVSAMPRRGQTT